MYLTTSSYPSPTLPHPHPLTITPSSPPLSLFTPPSSAYSLSHSPKPINNLSSHSHSHSWSLSAFYSYLPPVHSQIMRALVGGSGGIQFWAAPPTWGEPQPPTYMLGVPEHTTERAQREQPKEQTNQQRRRTNKNESKNRFRGEPHEQRRIGNQPETRSQTHHSLVHQNEQNPAETNQKTQSKHKATNKPATTTITITI